MEERIGAFSDHDPKLSIDNIRLMLVIFDVAPLLIHSAQREEWRKWLPDYCQTILSILDRYKELKDQLTDTEVGDDAATWNTIANKVEELAAAVCTFEGQLLAV
jgi:hypothetical protein